MSKKDSKSSNAILEDLYQELQSLNGNSDDNDVGSSSDEDEDEDERRSRKRKDKKKHKKSKKKKKKHKRSHSSDNNSDEHEDKDRRKEKRSSSKSSSRHENTKRVSRPLSPPVPTRRSDDYLPPQHDDYWHHDDSREVRRRVPPPPPPEEWVKKDSSENSPSRYDRSSHRDEAHRGRDREDDHREEREVRRSYSHDDRKEKRRHDERSSSRDREKRRHRDERSESRDRGKRHRRDERSSSRDREKRHHRDERSTSRDREKRHRRDERSSSRDKEKNHSRRSRESERQPKRSKEDDDAFWDSKWEASEIQKKADEKERKGRHFLAPEKRRPRTPTPEDRDSSPETSEALTIKRLKEIENLVVKDSEKYVAEPMNPDMFEWDEKTKMRRKKFVPIAKAESEEEEPEEKINTRELTLDEIEEIRRKREKNKKDKKKEKEEGELGSDEDRRSRSRRPRSRSPFTDRRHGGGFYDRRRSPPRRGGGFADFRRRRSRSRDRYDDRRTSRRRNSRSRSRERKRSGDGFRGSRSAIDKAKLLAIAQKNAVKLLNSNDLKGMDKGRLVAIKSGGQSLSELTLFCRELARKGITDEFSDDDNGVNSDEESNLNHPFEVRDRAIPNPIMLSVTGLKSITSTAPKNALTLASMTPAMRDAARSHRLNEFPVSSGNAHRVKEADITEEEDIKKIPTGLIAAQNAVTSLANSNDPIFKMLKLDSSIEMVKLPPLPTQLIQRKIPEVKPEPEEDFVEEKSKEEQLTEAQKLNLANPLGVIMFGGHLDPPLPPKEPEPALKTEFPMVPAPPEPPSVFKVPAIPAPDMSMGMNGPSSQAEPVFEPLTQPSKDISSIISIRLNAMKRLSSNPDDPVALKELYDAQQEMSTWAASKNKPGQFTGHTGAKVLSKGELMTGIQAWARSEQFTKAQKVSGGFGEYMLRKMGWREGDGLGKDRSGEVDPLQLDIKMDKKGLISAEEMVGKRGKCGNDALTMTGLKDMSGKHPVTAIMEVATRRKWGPPNFSQIFECGPPHKKQYIWKCTVNGIDYQPTIASDNKKKAKSNAATVALQELGMLAKDPNNPL